jgi:hypothetical protein
MIPQRSWTVISLRAGINGIGVPAITVGVIDNSFFVGMISPRN